MEGDKEINGAREFVLSTEGQFKAIEEDEDVSKQRNSDYSITRLIKEKQNIIFFSNCDDDENIHQTIPENSGSFSTSDTTFHSGQKTTQHSNYVENVSSDCMMARSPSLSSTISVAPNVELITIDSSDDENDGKNNTTVRGSSYLSFSVSVVPNSKLITLDSSDDEKANRDCIAEEHSSSANISGNSAYTSYQPAPLHYREESVFECMHCDSSFFEPHDLYFHTRIHGKPYICKRCSRSYLDAPGFIHHVERHARIGGIPFSCPKCNQGFCQKLLLKQHIMLCHKD